MEWLTHDEVRANDLPAWVEVPRESLAAGRMRVDVCAEGVVLRTAWRASALRFADILAVIRIDDDSAPRLLIATARRAPRPPWFELRGDALDAIERAVRDGVEAASAGGYRAAPRVRPALSAAQVLASVLAREPIAGAVEIRVPLPLVGRAAITAVAGGSAVSATALTLLNGVPSLVGVGALAVSGALGLAGGTLFAARQYRAASRYNRVLVLTPDAFVGGLDGRTPRAFAWPDIARFSVGVDPRGEPALEVHGVDGRLEARVSHVFFSEPVHVIVAIAEAYRRRATA